MAHGLDSTKTSFAQLTQALQWFCCVKGGRSEDNDQRPLSPDHVGCRTSHGLAP